MSIKDNLSVKYTNHGQTIKVKCGTNNISFRTTGGEKDSIPHMVLNDSNYFYDGEKTTNNDGTEITKHYFKSVDMPSKIYMDRKGNIIWSDYMNPVKHNQKNNNTIC
jgi:hypothetical protein